MYAELYITVKHRTMLSHSSSELAIQRNTATADRTGQDPQIPSTMATSSTARSAVVDLDYGFADAGSLRTEGVDRVGGVGEAEGDYADDQFVFRMLKESRTWPEYMAIAACELEFFNICASHPDKSVSKSLRLAQSSSGLSAPFSRGDRRESYCGRSRVRFGPEQTAEQ